jgi:aerobic carbon-monoxide dehydrogenase large subunit
MARRGRIEDDRLLLGQGRYTADTVPEGCLHAAFLRSPHAHAKLTRLSTDAAKVLPGIVAIYTAADLGPNVRIGGKIALKRTGGADAPFTPRQVLIGETSRHVGEPVAIVVAQSHAQALDAIEAIEAEFDELPAIVDPNDAIVPGAAAIWAEAPDNVAFLWRHGAADEVAEYVKTAAHVVRLHCPVSRVSAAPMEGRAVLAIPAGERLEAIAATQSPFGWRDSVAAALGITKESVHLRAEDVGGGFGLKSDATREEVATCWAARKLGRPVRWISDRAEALVCDDHGRDVDAQATLALDKDGKFLAFRVDYIVDIGAYVSGRSTGPINNIGGIAGVYATKAIAAEVRGVFTHSVPTVPYRGAGRPDATYVLERTIDLAAAQLGFDPIELRRRNLVPASAMPYRTPFLFEYDSGDFPAVMDTARDFADIVGFPSRRSASEAKGKLRGLGICNPIEVAGGPFTKPGADDTRIEIDAAGRAHIFTGAMSVGQGLETVWQDMLAERMGIGPEAIVYRQGDTDLMASGKGSGGSGGLSVSGASVALAMEAAIEEGRKRAADRLEAAVADIEFGDGVFRIAGTDRVASWSEVAGPEGLKAAVHFQPPAVTFPNGCHVCEVEVDPQTGAVEVVTYAAVEDIGHVMNFQLAEGQIHGGVAQGLGQALIEEVVHDPATGQILTGSFMDYAMPRASDMPPIRIKTHAVPTKVNTLGAKGVGEAGTVGALSAVVNAVCAALAPLGVRHIDMPLTPYRVWAAIQAAKN